MTTKKRIDEWTDEDLDKVLEDIEGIFDDGEYIGRWPDDDMKDWQRTALGVTPFEFLGVVGIVVLGILSWGLL